MKQVCGGVLESAKGTGTYSVKGNCTARADVEFTDGSAGTFHFTITDGGNTLMFVGATPGVTFTGMGEKL